MLSILKEKLLASPKSYHKKAAILVFFADICAIVYIHVYWIGMRLDELISLSLKMRGYSISDVLNYQEVKFLMANSLSNMLIFFMIWHTVIYILLFKKKSWAINYVYRYLFATLLISILEIINQVFNLSAWTLPVILINSLYLCTFILLRRTKEQ